MLQAGTPRGYPSLETEVIHLTQTMIQILKNVKETIILEYLFVFVMLENGILTYFSVVEKCQSLPVSQLFSVIPFHMEQIGKE